MSPRVAVAFLSCYLRFNGSLAVIYQSAGWHWLVSAELLMAIYCADTDRRYDEHVSLESFITVILLSLFVLASTDIRLN